MSRGASIRDADSLSRARIIDTVSRFVAAMQRRGKGVAAVEIFVASTFFFSPFFTLVESCSFPDLFSVALACSMVEVRRAEKKRKEKKRKEDRKKLKEGNEPGVPCTGPGVWLGLALSLHCQLLVVARVNFSRACYRSKV